MSLDPVLNGAAFVAGLVIFLVTQAIYRRIKRRRAAKAAAQWHILDVPVRDPETGELLGWVPTRSDTGEALPVALYGTKTPSPALGDQDALNGPENGAQGRREASS